MTSDWRGVCEFTVLTECDGHWGNGSGSQK